MSLFNDQFFHDVSLSEKISIFACDFSKFFRFIYIHLDFFTLLDYSLERYLDGLLHNQFLSAAGSRSSSDILLRIFDIVTSNKLLDRGLLIYLFLQI